MHAAIRVECFLLFGSEGWLCVVEGAICGFLRGRIDQFRLQVLVPMVNCVPVDKNVESLKFCFGLVFDGLE